MDGNSSKFSNVRSLNIPNSNSSRNKCPSSITTPKGSFGGRSMRTDNGEPLNYALIDIQTPNFKTVHPNREGVIINSLRDNYLNTSTFSRKFSKSSHSGSDYKSANGSQLNFHSEQNDETSPKIQNVNNNISLNNIYLRNDDSVLLDHDSNMHSEGGDITRDFYNIVKKTDPESVHNSHVLQRTKSSPNIAPSSIAANEKISASGINIPGGFRREYIVNKLRSKQKLKDTFVNKRHIQDRCDGQLSSLELSGYGSIEESEDYNNKVPFLTRNFLEFLYVYGHFAGESFEDDFISEIDKQYLTGTPGQIEEVPLLSRKGISRVTSGVRVSKPMIQTAKGKTPTTKAFLLLLKSFIGTGILFLPNAFSKGGLLFSIGMLLFFGLYSYWCYFILIRSKQITKVSSFGDIGLILYGRWMKTIILCSLVLTQIGFSAAYVIFCAKNLRAFIINVFNFPDFNISYLMIFQLIVFIPLSFVRNVSKLSLTSLMANFMIMGGLLIVLFFCIKHLFIDLQMKPEAGVIYGFNPDLWSVFIGTAIFAFEGIGLIIPVQDSMKHPEHFPFVLFLVILTATVLFILIGTIGYLAYGKYIETVILMNLSQSNVFVNLVQLFYSVAILLSTPLQLFPAIKIIENRMFTSFRSTDNGSSQFLSNSGKLNWRIKWRKNCLRSIIVSCVILIAYLGYNNLDKFVSLIGSFACIPLVYMYPPMLHLKSYSIPSLKQHKFNFTVIFDFSLIVLGGISMLYTSYRSIMDS
ncbi:hypothetical protein TPHA_0B02980 [Tetrapisispora phaffii CBS 4417]|uniref:Amino acid transporter transmembrane domain-containing protein n=1 Tax=Tetrapisispora phaffii (strain ATCC 24235 / CBS 4417 / NBRC 1672 / NRRL Y-8282 / UCD 70-5) TaxID=1071381 RepID=G8BPN9_TETPH|nr:hypothetical protein TPHA_0B02980 [Tetrapisispora phaffii CBS 4417]CCE61970.1 hypothetical protein TPHA_0B02980 [Tetrapisispora phaffii CBS 4417]